MPAILDKFAEAGAEQKAIVDGIRGASKKRNEWLSQMVQQVKEKRDASKKA